MIDMMSKMGSSQQLFRVGYASSPLLRTLLMMLNSLTSVQQFLRQLIFLKLPMFMLLALSSLPYFVAERTQGRGRPAVLLCLLKSDTPQGQNQTCTSWPLSWSGLKPQKGSPQRRAVPCTRPA